MEIPEIVVVLRAMMDNAQYIYNEEKQNHKIALRNRMAGEVRALESVILMLTDDAYAAKMAAIYCKEG